MKEFTIAKYSEIEPYKLNAKKEGADLSSKVKHWFKLEVNKKFVGCIGLSGRIIRGWYIIPEERKKGYGTYLLTRIEQEAKELGLNYVIMHTLHTEFVKKLGYITVKIWKTKKYSEKLMEKLIKKI